VTLRHSSITSPIPSERRILGSTVDPPFVAIRPAQATDAHEIARLTIQLGYEVKLGDVSARLNRVLPDPQQQVFTAHTGERIVGWLHIRTSETLETARHAEIAGIVVDAAERGQGVGRDLIERAESWAREKGCSVIRLRTTTTRHEAHKFYERMGYSNLKTQFSFAKALDGHTDLAAFVPNVQPR
jgi:GNAT superfamily N-acetyltransferase